MRCVEDADSASDTIKTLPSANGILLIWSKSSCARERWAPEEMYYDTEGAKFISILVDDCELPGILAEVDGFKLKWLSGAHDHTGDLSKFNVTDGIFMDETPRYWALVNKCARICSFASISSYAIYRMNRQHSLGDGTLRRNRFWRYSDLLAMVDKCEENVRTFDPDFFFSLDARGGQWAQILSERTASNSPVITGMRIKRDGLRKSYIDQRQSPLFEICDVIATERWELFIPPIVSEIPVNGSILIVDDYSLTGETCRMVKQHFIKVLGFSEEQVKTLALFIAPEPSVATSDPDFFGLRSDALTNDLVYMHLR